MPELAYLAWELKAANHRNELYRKAKPQSPEKIGLTSKILLAATFASFAFGFAGNVVGLLQIGSEWTTLRIAYILLLALEALLLTADIIAALAIGCGCFRRKMGDLQLSSFEFNLRRVTIFAALALIFLCDLPTNALKFSYLHFIRFSSPDIRVAMLVSGVLSTTGQALKVVLLLLHFVWKQMSSDFDPLQEKAPSYFPPSSLADSLIWGITMMMPVVNLLLAASVACMAFMTTSM